MCGWVGEREKENQILESERKLYGSIELPVLLSQQKRERESVCVCVRERERERWNE